MLKKCLFILPLLILLLGLNSCGGNNIYQTENWNIYDYKIGLNQKIIMECSYLKDIDDIKLSNNSNPTIVAINDSKKLFDTFQLYNDGFLQFSITCIKEFESPIQITSMTYRVEQKEIRVKTTIQLEYNEDYMYQPSFSTSYQEFYERGEMMNSHKTCGIYSKNYNDFYFDFSTKLFKYSSTDSFIIKNVYLVNNPYIAIKSIKIASRPSVISFPQVLDEIQEFIDFQEPMEVIREDSYGMVLEYSLEYIGEVVYDRIVIGVDMVFEMIVNGDSFTIYLPILFEYDSFYSK